MTKNGSSSTGGEVVVAGGDLRSLIRSAKVSNEIDDLAKLYEDRNLVDLKHMKPEDLVSWPFVRLLQSGSPPVAEGRGGARPGVYWDVMNERVLETPLMFVPVFSYMSRARWPKVGEGDNRPLCRSVDGKTGFGVPGGDCFACPAKKRWVNDEDKPIGDCDEVYNFIVYVFETRGLHSLTLQRTSSACGRLLTKTIAARRKRCFTAAYLLGSEARKMPNQPTIYQVARLETFEASGSRWMALTAFEECRGLLVDLEKQAAELAGLYDAGRIAPVFEESGGGATVEEKGDDSFDPSAFDAKDEPPKAPPAPEKSKAKKDQF